MIRMALNQVPSGNLIAERPSMPTPQRPTSPRIHLAVLALVGLIAVGAADAVLAAGSPSRHEINDAERRYNEAVALVYAGDYRKAIDKLEYVYRRYGADADTLNYLGFAHRKLGDYDRALGYYKEALKMEPEHVGANEYLGELYVQTGKMALAEQHLAKLNQICGRCQEYQMLSSSIAAAKANAGAS